jgi:hypothetical protein
VGINLGIDPAKLTVEKLTATPGLKQKPKVTDDYLPLVRFRGRGDYWVTLFMLLG